VRFLHSRLPSPRDLHSFPTRRSSDLDPQKTEKDVSFYLEEPSYATMGLCYEKSPRFSGAVYNSFVRRLVEFSGEPLSKTLRAHRSEEHTSELQSRRDLVCRLLLEKKK